MKKFFLLSAAALVITAAVHAQTSKKEVKYNEKVLHKVERATKHEIRKVKKELRKLEGKEVSYQSKQAFYRDFGNVPEATWKRGTYFDEVTFTNKRGKKMTAYYDYDADLVGTTTHIRFSDIPASAQNYINKKYSRYSKEDVIFFHDNQENETDMVLYNEPFADANNYFVELKKGNEEIILRADKIGAVSFFKKM